MGDVSDRGVTTEQTRGQKLRLKLKGVKKERLEKPPVQIEWSGVFEGYARNYVSRNLWRVSAYLGDRDDALQQCALTFYECKARYQNHVDNPAWFMALYKRALMMDFADISRKDFRLRDTPMPLADEPVDFNAGPLISSINQCSDDIKELLVAIFDSPAQLLSLVFGDYDANKEGKRAAAREQEERTKLNSRIRHLLGISASADRDLVAELRDALSA